MDPVWYVIMLQDRNQQQYNCFRIVEVHSCTTNDIESLYNTRVGPRNTMSYGQYYTTMIFMREVGSRLFNADRFIQPVPKAEFPYYSFPTKPSADYIISEKGEIDKEPSEDEPKSTYEPFVATPEEEERWKL